MKILLCLHNELLDTYRYMNVDVYEFIFVCVNRESSLSSMRGLLKLDSVDPTTPTSGSDIHQVR